MQNLHPATETNGKNLFDIAIALYDRAPILTGFLLVVVVMTPFTWIVLRYQTKKEERELERFKHLSNKRKAKKNRRKSK